MSRRSDREAVGAGDRHLIGDGKGHPLHLVPVDGRKEGIGTRTKAIVELDLQPVPTRCQGEEERDPLLALSDETTIYVLVVKVKEEAPAIGEVYPQVA